MGFWEIAAYGIAVWCFQLAGGINSLGEVFQSMWGGKVRALVAENEELRDQLKALESHETKELRARVEIIEDAVTDDDAELNRRLSRLPRD